MCNYNMSATLEKSITTIASQLNEQFEIIVVDDGSSDDSLDVLSKLQKKFPIIKIVKLTRDSKRKLGATRNISIENATGEYVLLHIDCDDVYGPHIIDFTIAFHQIEQIQKNDFLLSGQHVNMAKRSFLLKHGPYRNIFYTEDRDMWSRLAAINAYIPFQHVNFVERLPKTKRDRALRSFVYTWRIMQNDFRSGSTLFGYVKDELTKRSSFTTKLRIYRLAILIPVWVSAKCHEQLVIPENMNSSEKIVEYRRNNSGTLTQLLQKAGKEPDFSQMSPNGKSIFGE